MSKLRPPRRRGSRRASRNNSSAAKAPVSSPIPGERTSIPSARIRAAISPGGLSETTVGSKRERSSRRSSCQSASSEPPTPLEVMMYRIRAIWCGIVAGVGNPPRPLAKGRYALKRRAISLTRGIATITMEHQSATIARPEDHVYQLEDRTGRHRGCRRSRGRRLARAAHGGRAARDHVPEGGARPRQVHRLGVRRGGQEKRPAPGARLGEAGREVHAAVLRGLSRPRDEPARGEPDDRPEGARPGGWGGDADRGRAGSLAEEFQGQQRLSRGAGHDRHRGAAAGHPEHPVQRQPRRCRRRRLPPERAGGAHRGLGRRSFLPRLPRGGGRGGGARRVLRDPARRAGCARLQPRRQRRGRQRGAPRLRRASAREGFPRRHHRYLRPLPRREDPGVPRRRPRAPGRPGGGLPRREPRLARPRPQAHPRGVRHQFAGPPLERALPADAEHEEHGGLGAGPHLQAQRAGHRPPDAPRPRPRLHRRGPGAGGQHREGGVLRRSRHLRPGGDPRPRPGDILAVRAPEQPRRQAGRAGGAGRGGGRERPDRDGRRRPPALLGPRGRHVRQPGGVARRPLDRGQRREQARAVRGRAGR